MRIRDPGWKKVGSGIRDKHPIRNTEKSTVWKRLDFPQGLAHGFFPLNPRFLFAIRKTLDKKSSSLYFFSPIF
jgi:hypothetical protein